MIRKKIDYFIALCLLTPLLMSCGDQAWVPTFDTPVSLVILTTDEVRADSVDIRVFNKKTLEEIDICESNPDLCHEGRTGSHGQYVIFHNQLMSLMNGEIDIIAEGKKDSLFFRDEFTIARDGDRVFKTAGPDTVFLEPKKENPGH